MRVFDHLNSKFRAREITCNSGAEFVEAATKVPDVRNVMDEDASVGDFDMVDSVALAAAQGTPMTLNTNGIGNGRKRKERMNDNGDTRVKFLRKHLHDNPLREKSFPLV